MIDLLALAGVLILGAAFFLTRRSSNSRLAALEEENVAIKKSLSPLEALEKGISALKRDLDYYRLDVVEAQRKLLEDFKAYHESVHAMEETTSREPVEGEEVPATVETEAGA